MGADDLEFLREGVVEAVIPADVAATVEEDGFGGHDEWDTQLGCDDVAVSFCPSSALLLCVLSTEKV